MFAIYRREDDTTHLQYSGKPPKLLVNGKASHPPRDWQALAGQYAASLTTERRRELSAELYYASDILDTLPLIGWDGDAYTFPECDGAGHIVGITRRLPDGGKRAVTGSRRGLTLPTGWRDRPGAVYVVEGPTDAAALSALGLSAVGRPSNTGGAEMLAELLRDLPADRPVVVLGEHDEKDDGTWPGRDGAIAVASKLSAALGRAIPIALPPEGIKDARAWVRDLIASAGESEDREEFAREIVAHLDTAESVVTTDSAAEPAPVPQFEFIDCAQFLITDYHREFLIDGILTANEPGGVAGPSKTLKTSLVVDGAVSLATGNPFLGTFTIPKPIRVAIVSGESGAASLQSTCRRVMQAKGIDADALGGRLKWCFELPRFPDVVNMTVFAERLLRLESQVVFIDPVYLCVGAEIEHSNMFQMGAAFRVVGELLLKRGVTPILVHHANRQLKVGEPMEITHLAYSGLEQFLRQWVLLNRQTTYKHDGVNDLWVSAGGSAGHSGLYHVHIEEGVADHTFGGRKWDVQVVNAHELQAQTAQSREQQRREAELRRVKENGTRVLEAIDAAVKAGDPAASKNSIKERTNLRQAQLDDAICALHDEGVIEIHHFRKRLNNGAGRDVIGWRRFTQEPDQPAIIDTPPTNEPPTRTPKPRNRRRSKSKK